MVQADSPDNSNTLQRKQNEQPSVVYAPRTWPTVAVALSLVAVGSIGVSLLINFSRAITDTATAYSFIAQNTLSLFVFLAVVAQACIYWGQRNLMLQQWRAMQAQLSAAHQQTDFVRIQAEAMISQLDIMNTQVGAMNNQTGVMINQGNAMINQTNLMMLSVQETHKMVEQNADVVKAMQGQLEAINKQAETMDRQASLMDTSLIISYKAYVGIHSIELNKTKETIFIKIENVGHLPADHIKVAIETLTSMPIEVVDIAKGVRSQTRRRMDKDFGGTKLIRGNLQIIIPIHLWEGLSPEEIRLIGDSTANAALIVRGNIEYRDAFLNQPIQRNEFFFTYEASDECWSADAPEPWNALFDMSGPADNKYRDESGDENPN
jgi:hypothetical protein